jgi:hypothetical protein
MRLSIQALAAAITRFALMLSLAFTLTQRAAVAAIPPPSPHLVLDLPPHAVCQPFARTLSGDLSAGVRMHRGDKTLDVWLLTPLSQYWNEDVANAAPLSEQLHASGWLDAREKSANTKVRFERIMPPPPGAMMKALRPRPMLRA